MADLNFNIKATTTLEDGSKPSYATAFTLPKSEAALKERFGKEVDVVEFAALEIQRRMANAARAALREGKSKAEIDAALAKWTPGQKAHASVANQAKKMAKELPPERAAEFEKALADIVKKYAK